MTVPSGDTPLRQTDVFLKAQDDRGFHSWLAMQNAAMELEFVVSDVPELRGHLYTREGLVIAEPVLVERYQNRAEAYSENNFKVTSRFAYFIGETIRRATEGRWVALPQSKGGALPGVDVEFRSGFFNVNRLVTLTLIERTGTELTMVFDYAVEDYDKWVEAGRPPRV